MLMKRQDIYDYTERSRIGVKIWNEEWWRDG
jgi:hypothetical protein